jgi:hypothetical protein
VCNLVVIKIFKNVSFFAPKTLYLNSYYIIHFNTIINAKRGIYKLIFKFLKNIMKWLLSYIKLKFRVFSALYTVKLNSILGLVVLYIIKYYKILIKSFLFKRTPILCHFNNIIILIFWIKE